MATTAEPAAQVSESAFREDVRAFIQSNFPPELKGTSNALASVESGAGESEPQRQWREAVSESTAVTRAPMMSIMKNPVLSRRSP